MGTKNRKNKSERNRGIDDQLATRLRCRNMNILVWLAEKCFFQETNCRRKNGGTRGVLFPNEGVRRELRSWNPIQSDRKSNREIPLEYRSNWATFLVNFINRSAFAYLSKQCFASTRCVDSGKDDVTFWRSLYTRKFGPLSDVHLTLPVPSTLQHTSTGPSGLLPTSPAVLRWKKRCCVMKRLKPTTKDSLPNYRILLGCAMNSPPSDDVPSYGAVEAAIFINDVTLLKEVLLQMTKQKVWKKDLLYILNL